MIVRSKRLIFRLAPAMIVPLLILAGGCQISGPDDEPGLDELETRILALIGDAPAQEASSCRAIAFGSKPCGGPWAYLIYSTEFTDDAELTDLVEEYNQVQARVNREKGTISDCMFVTPPDIAHQGGYCTQAAESQ